MDFDGEISPLRESNSLVASVDTTSLRDFANPLRLVPPDNDLLIIPEFDVVIAGVSSTGFALTRGLPFITFLQK